MLSFRVLGLVLLDGRGEGRQRGVPHLVQVLAHGSDSRWVNAIDPTSPFCSIGDQPRPLEHLQVLGDGRPAHWQRVCQLTYRPRSSNQSLEDGASGWIAERLD